MRIFSNDVFSWTAALTAALVAVPLLLFAAGCDSGGDGGGQAPTAQFTYSPPNPQVNQEVTFDAGESSDDGSIDSYEWEFGDGTKASGQTTTRTFEAATSVSAQLTVTDDEGLSGSTQQTVSVGTAPPPTVRMSANYDTTGSVIRITETDAKEGVVPIDQDGNEMGDDAAGEVTWTSDYTYILDGLVFVNAGQTLHIAPGTLIKGTKSFDPSNTGTLIITQDGMIDAAGTQSDPIIFTANQDDTPLDDTFDFTNRGFWGGVIMLGNAPNNLGESGDGPGTNHVEGLETIDRAVYGCTGSDCDAMDDSGTFQYVSLRFGGFELAPGDEINGVTLGSVGAGTTIDHIEVASNLDDAIEFFGGTVQVKYFVAAFVGDDSFDIDQGFGGTYGGRQGGLQYLLAVQGFEGGNRLGEHDGGDKDFGGEDSTPVGRPQICNATYVGGPGGDVALKLRDNFGGSYYNSIFTSTPNGLVEIENIDGDGDSFNEFSAGNLRIENNLVLFPDASSFADVVENEGDDGTKIADYLASDGAANQLLSSIDGFSFSFDGETLESLDVFPASGSAADDAGNSSECLESTDYKGAFEPGGENWAAGWTALSQSGILADN